MTARDVFDAIVMAQMMAHGTYPGAIDMTWKVMKDVFPVAYWGYNHLRKRTHIMTMPYGTYIWGGFEPSSTRPDMTFWWPNESKFEGVDFEEACKDYIKQSQDDRERSSGRVPADGAEASGPSQNEQTSSGASA